MTGNRGKLSLLGSMVRVVVLGVLLGVCLFLGYLALSVFS
jgi:hypothetical protein